MITTVTLNPAIDKTLSIEHFEVNKVNRVKTIHESLGGKGINVARVLNTLGSISTAIGFIGEKNLNRILSFNTQEALSTNFVSVDADTRTNTKIIDPVTQNTTDINEPGFEVSAKHIDQIKMLIQRYSAQSSFIVFSGSVCKGITSKSFTQLLKSVHPSCKLVLDAEGEMLKAGLSASPYLIKPNIHELRSLLNQKLSTQDEIIQACQKLIKTHSIEHILVSMGEEGSLLISKDSTLKANALKTKVVSTVGAGDSMLAGYIHAYLKTKNQSEALRYAATSGSIAVMGIGLDAFKTTKVEDHIKHIHVSQL